MARPRCAALHHPAEGPEPSRCMWAAAPGSRFCARPPAGRGHIELEHARWDGHVSRPLFVQTRHGLTVRHPGHPLANGNGWAPYCLVLLLAEREAGKPVECGHCGWAMPEELDGWQMRADRPWCGACRWSSTIHD